MRDCKKNARTMYYALYGEKIPILDDDGFDTLECTIGYSNPVQFKCSLSSGNSDSEESPFGTDVSYDRIIFTCNTSLPVDENSLIWEKSTPEFDDNGKVIPTSADYKVTAVLDGLNSLRIAIKKLNRTDSGE